MNVQNWFVPITLIPAVGLFVLSTSSLSAVMGSEINELLEKANTSHNLIKKKIAQLKRLNVALTTLYLSAICFAISGFLGSLGTLNLGKFDAAFIILMVVGIALLIVVIVLMIMFAFKAIYNREQQFREKMDKQVCPDCGKKLK